ELPRDEAMLRRISSLVSSLPALDTPRFKSEYLAESNDALLAVILAALTKITSCLSDTVDKVLVAYDRSASKGGRRGVPPPHHGFL
ncbi:MPN domain-containing protein, partial [Haematococcus lacustris]